MLDAIKFVACDFLRKSKFLRNNLHRELISDRTNTNLNEEKRNINCTFIRIIPRVIFNISIEM
jgi:hypothetical protein